MLEAFGFSQFLINSEVITLPNHFFLLVFLFLLLYVIFVTVASVAGLEFRTLGHLGYIYM